MGGVNLLRPMPSLRELTPSSTTCRSRIPLSGPSFWGDGMYPPSDAVYYPLYTKCAELDLPLCINTGLPGPPIPGEVQNPIHLDRVCVRFPELKLCMIHGADPWWDVAIRLLIKYENLRLMTSAWSPKRLPDSLSALHAHPRAEEGHLRLRLAGAPDEPRGAGGARAGPARRTCSTNYLYNNAEEFFFGQHRGVSMDRYELRRVDYSLSEDQTDLQSAYQKFFKTNCSIEVGPGRRGERLRQEPVGTVVRHGRDDDGAAGIRRR